MSTGEYPDQPVPPSRRRTADTVLYSVAANLAEGATQSEVSAHLQIGHGAASGALTRLHRADEIVRLAEKRDGKYVYVLPEHAGNRPISSYTPQKGTGTVSTIDRQDVRTIAYVMAADPRFSEEHLAQFLGQHGIQVTEA